MLRTSSLLVVVKFKSTAAAPPAPAGHENPRTAEELFQSESDIPAGEETRVPGISAMWATPGKGSESAYALDSKPAANKVQTKINLENLFITTPSR